MNRFKQTFLRWATVVIGLSVALDAVAQVPLPAPQLPPIRLPTPSDAIGVLNAPQRLQNLRRQRARELLRTYRRELEADQNGAPIVRAEIVAYAPTDASLQIAQSLGFSVIRESTLAVLNTKVVIFSPPTGVSTRAALRRLRRADREGTYDFNHVYIESGIVNEGRAAASKDIPSAQSYPQTRVGLIDTGIAPSHPSLQGSAIRVWGCDTNIAAPHGTAVASLLVGQSHRFAGAAAGAQLYAADVYCGRPTGGAVEAIVGAFAWLAQEKVPVINVSLVGPPNALLQKVIAMMTKRGHVIVAAVGNDGPSAPRLYPAAYDGVIGVTGVDARRRVLLEAGRGNHVDFAAPGADMEAAGVAGDYVAVRGTSFAAPIVAGLLARPLLSLDSAHAERDIAELATQALDLGAKGVDKTYGRGLVGESIRVSLAPPAVAK